MEIIALIGMLYFLIGAGACLLVCVDQNNPGLLGKMKRLVFQRLPTILSKIVKKVFGEGSLQQLEKLKVWFMESNHPLVQWFYYLIAPGGLIGYSITGIFRHMPNQYVSDFHVIVAYVLAGFCFWIYYKACSVSPGEIDSKTVASYVQKYKDYYDGVMYQKNNKCETCNIIKPARSKHCRTCRTCVSKFDHHCVWIRQCVGQKNYKYFISFLFFHSILCIYFSVIGGLSLYASLQKMRFWNLQFRIGNQIVDGDNLLALQFVFFTQTLFTFLIVMCAIMGITLFIFVCYHFYLIKQGNTTNERIKRNDGIYFYKRQKKELNKIIENNKQLSDIIQFHGQKMKKQQFIQYTSVVNYRISVLQKKNTNGFIHNLKEVFREPDH